MEHEKYANYIQLKNPRDILFQETIFLLTKTFGKRSLLFNTCWQCLNLTKKNTDNYTIFASVVNRECKKFKLSELTPDMFKCLMYIQGLTAPKDVEIRSRLLSNLEQDLKLTLQNIPEECQCIINLHHETAKIEERNILLLLIEKKEHGKKKIFF